MESMYAYLTRDTNLGIMPFKVPSWRAAKALTKEKALEAGVTVYMVYNSMVLGIEPGGQVVDVPAETLHHLLMYECMVSQ